MCSTTSHDCLADFGHELITAVHTPIVWSDRRPTDKEFRDSFGATKLSAQKILDFMHQRQSVIQKVVLTNSEGYWSGERRFILLSPSGCCFKVVVYLHCYCVSSQQGYSLRLSKLSWKTLHIV